MLKTKESTGSAANLKETKSKTGGNSVVGNMVSGNEAINPIKRKNQAKITKYKILVKSKNHNFLKSRTEEARTGFLTPKARLAFIQLRQAFVKTPILHHFDLESHIRIETNASGYTINSILSQLSSGTRLDEIVSKADLGQWHPVAFFFRKMILVETQYKTHNGKLLAIIEAFKI